MLAAATPIPVEVLEALMLVCFGFSWPFSIARMVRTRSSQGKSLLFVSLVETGYMFGLASKLVEAALAGTWPRPITLLYLALAIVVGIDLLLAVRYRRLAAEKVAPARQSMPTE
jgi:hypothetical protein